MYCIFIISFCYKKNNKKNCQHLSTNQIRELNDSVVNRCLCVELVFPSIVSRWSLAQSTGSALDISRTQLYTT